MTLWADLKEFTYFNKNKNFWVTGKDQSLKPYWVIRDYSVTDAAALDNNGYRISLWKNDRKKR